MSLPEFELVAGSEKLKEKGVLVFGSGYIGTALTKGLAEGGIKISSSSSKDLDITDRENVFKKIAEFPGKCIILAAAITDVAEIEKDEKLFEKAKKVNIEGAKNVAEACAKNGKNLIFIASGYERAGSTNYQGPYAENDPLADEAKDAHLLGKYADTKLKGQREVELAFKNAKSNLATVFIDYPCGNVEGVSETHKRPWYLQTLLLNQKKKYKAFSDQQLTITDISDLVEVVKVVKENSLSGNFHVAARGLTTPFQLLKYMMEKLGEDTSTVLNSSVIEYSQDRRAKGGKCIYPIWGGLKTTETTAMMQKYKGLEYQFKTWQEVVDSCMRNGLKDFWRSINS